MKNLFTFGCSHTNHGYPTWADILGEQFENHYNFGMGGTGVFFSFYQMISIIQNKEKSGDDTSKELIEVMKLQKNLIHYRS